MSVGTGIFLSAVFLGIVALFVATKDRWNWKKIVVRSLLGIVLLVVLGGAGIYGWILYSERPPQPVSMSEFWGVTLAASKGDVKFLKGEPPFVDKSEISGQKVELWIFGDPERVKGEGKKGRIAWDSYAIYFRGDEIRTIAYVGEDSWKGPALQGIRIGASLEEIRRLLGDSTDISIADDDLTRIVSYRHLNSFFELRRNEVREMGIFNQKFGPPKYRNEKERKS